MTTASTDQPMLPNKLQADEEIDLGQVAGAFARRWHWIAGGGTIGLLLSGLYLLTAKPVYQGEFQIVLSNEKGSGAASLLSQNPGLAAIAGLAGASGSDSIATEVQILKSPSVLRPVFDAVASRKPLNKPKRCGFKIGPNRQSRPTRRRALPCSTLNFATPTSSWCYRSPG